MYALHPYYVFTFFFFTDTATTEIYTLSLHDALPISRRTSSPPRPARDASGTRRGTRPCARGPRATASPPRGPRPTDRKSTRLNSSHTVISYAVFCLKKKKNKPDKTNESHS